MVRLKVRYRQDAHSVLSFQFHYGTIKSVKRPKWDTVFAHFNSTMVRLKVFVPGMQGHMMGISIPLWYD